MKKKFRWLYVYVGFWECYITDKALKAPYILVSKHKTVIMAEKFIEKHYPSANILYDKDIQDKIWWAEFMDEEEFNSNLYVHDFSDIMEVA